MPRRQQHNIESNCVSFEDDCYNEQEHKDTYVTMYQYETEKMKEFADKVYRTGVDFVKDLEQKLRNI